MVKEDNYKDNFEVTRTYLIKEGNNVDIVNKILTDLINNDLKRSQ